MNERILAIVVTYQPDIVVLEQALNALTQQNCDVLIADNGSENSVALEQVCVDREATTLLPLKKNLGLGAAHNVGIKHARANGYDFVLIMDQDSVPLDNMVANLLAAHRTKSQVSKVSAVGVVYLNADTGGSSFFVRFGKFKFQRHYCADRDADDCVEADFLISSGSLLSMQAIDVIGDMDEGLFIDHVDTEWFLRANAKEYKAYGVCGATMQHGLGENTHIISLGGRKRNVPQHSPFRYYYIFRNSVLLYKRGYPSFLWKWNDAQRLAMIVVMFGLIKTPRWANLSMMLKGFWHGVLGRRGPLVQQKTNNSEFPSG